jgi:hypothetical protein
MTSLLGARRRAEEFAAAVDGAPGASLRPELAPLVDLVEALRSHEPPAPRREYAEALRERLLAEAARTLGPDPAPPAERRGKRERRLALAAASVVLVGGTAGVATATQDALPGDVLYPLKRGIEQAQAGLGTSPAARGERLLDQAENRLAEVEGLLRAGDDSEHVPTTIKAFTGQATEGADLLLASFADDREPEAIDEVRTFSAESVGVLEELAEVAPAGAQDELARAAQAMLEIDRRASEACRSCASELPPLVLPDMFLTAAEVDRALERGQRVADNRHPALPGSPADKGARGGGSGGSGGGRAPQPSTAPAPGLPDVPALPGVPDAPRDTSTRAPRDVGEVVDEVVEDVRETTDGVLDDVDETVDEVLPKPLKPLKEQVTDPLTDPLLP